MNIGGDNMSHNTIIKRLCRNFQMSPRDARILCRKCKYDLDLIESALLYKKLNNLRISTDKIGEAFASFTNVIVEIAEKLGRACSAAAEAFANEIMREV